MAVSTYVVSFGTPGWLARCAVLATSLQIVGPTYWTMLASQIVFAQLLRAALFCSSLPFLVPASALGRSLQRCTGFLWWIFFRDRFCPRSARQQKHGDSGILAQSRHQRIQGNDASSIGLQRPFVVLCHERPKLSVCPDQLLQFDRAKAGRHLLAQRPEELVHPSVMNTPCKKSALIHGESTSLPTPLQLDLAAVVCFEIFSKLSNLELLVFDLH